MFEDDVESSDRCAEVGARIYEYLDNEMPAPERAKVAAHLAACPACREIEVSERAFLSAVREKCSGQDPCPEHVQKRIADEIRRRRQERSRR